MLTNLSDIYTAAIGDKIVLNKSLTTMADVYAEAIENNKWVTVIPHMVNNTYVVEIIDPTTIKNKDITDHIIVSEYHGMEENGKISLLMPNHINLNSLKSRMYTRCQDCDIKIFEQYIILTKKVKPFSTLLIINDFNTGDIKTIDKSKCKNVKSTISALYKAAGDNQIAISINNKTRSIVITHLGDIDYTGQVESFTAKLHHWLNELPYDMSVEIPERFTDVKTSAYINTVLNKSKFTCKVHRGVITKLSAALKKKNGVIQVIVNERVIKEINKGSLTNIDSRDRKLINLSLKPYKLKYEDIR